MVSNSNQIIKLLKKIMLLTTSLVILITFTTQLMAEDAANAKDYFGIYHQPRFESTTLPPPGHPLQLTVQLFNTKDTNIPLRTIAVIDGRMIELTPARVFLNRDDYPEYVIETHAPESSFEYFFIAYGNSGYVAKSENFAFKRPCQPDIKPAHAELTTEARDGANRLTEAVHKTWALERELKTHEHLEKIIKSIDAELERLSSPR